MRNMVEIIEIILILLRGNLIEGEILEEISIQEEEIILLEVGIHR